MKEEIGFEEWLSKLVQELGSNDINRELALDTLSFNERKAPEDPTAVAFATLNRPAYHEWMTRVKYQGSFAFNGTIVLAQMAKTACAVLLEREHLSIRTLAEDALRAQTRKNIAAPVVAPAPGYLAQSFPSVLVAQEELLGL